MGNSVKMIAATGFEKLPNLQQIAQSGHTGSNAPNRSFRVRTNYFPPLTHPQHEKLSSLSSAKFSAEEENRISLRLQSNSGCIDVIGSQQQLHH